MARNERGHGFETGRPLGTSAGDVLASAATHQERIARLSGRACDRRAAELLRELATREQRRAALERQRRAKNRAKSRGASEDIREGSSPDVPRRAGGTSGEWEATRRGPASVTLRRKCEG